jgi:UDP-N-acetylglucosamine--N-acetylmuramyl-(pentapeptide) pyrophosphoryl-undecaprenol N-acetylglucosamine transferase
MTILFVASTGGHLAQLFELAGRMSSLKEDRLWVSFDSEQARTLLDGEKKVFIPYIAERDVAGVLRALWHAHQIMNSPRSVSAVVSTGSAIALSFLPYAALKGIEAHYIESAARVGQPSLTGRVLQNVPGVRLYRQYPHVATRRWGYGGSVFDGLQVMCAKPPLVKRVVVTVGTDKPFRRLIEAAAAILPGDIEVLWQTGPTPTEGLGIDARPYIPAPVLEQSMRDADAVIAHAGCGSALMALMAGKYPVLVPRDPLHGEVIDVHQIEIARWLSQRRLAFECTADELTFADVERAAARAVIRLSELPPFHLSAA